ncbi:MAG TPA: hypothetical protein VGX94_01965 [Terriglobia bacterium]|nr:hypothetical protein [Terriglobia bacterium]
MGVLTIGEVFEQVALMGGSLGLNGERVELVLPDVPEADALTESVRLNRDVIAAMLKDQESRAPSVEEVKAILPAGVRLVSYQPKEAPFAVNVANIVTNAGRFYRAHFADLARRLEKPEGYHCPPLSDILGKLGAAGLELKIERGCYGSEDQTGNGYSRSFRNDASGRREAGTERSAESERG